MKRRDPEFKLRIADCILKPEGAAQANLTSPKSRIRSH